ncbi:MAG TPA: hypothetical protein VKA63_06540 [Candidatus Krumholzibacteria bacterium]|nr:hypothetical protein [Candidatus Krumholzibacteria bacterium]
MFNKRLFSLVLTAGLILGLAGLAMAGVPDPGASVVYTTGGDATLTPGGLAQSLASYGVSVTVTVRDGNGLPIPAFPAQDIWLDDDGSADINLCQSGSTADAQTDGDGFTTISGILSGGGNTQGGLSAYVSGVAIAGGQGPSLSINLNSPDINGDRIVDLGDISLFNADVQPPNNAFRSDFTHDGIVDLGDVSLFSSWIDDVCP